MKKAYFSIAALLFSGVLLASCSNGGFKVSKLDKGKKVDSVSFSIGDDAFEIKKDDDAKEVIDKLADYSIYYNNTGDEYKYNYISKNKMKMTGENVIVRQNEISKKASVVMDINYNVDYFYKNDGDNYEAYVNNNTNTENDLVTDGFRNYSKTSMNSRKGGSKVLSDNGDRSVDFAIYKDTSSKTISKNNVENENESNTEKVYKYLNKTEKTTDEDYGKEYVGYDSNGEDYSYRVSTFFNAYSEVTPTLSFSLDDFYDEEYKEYFKDSFELTDKYIILKCETKYNDELTETAELFLAAEGIENPTSEQIKEKIKSLLKKEYKNVTIKSEIWIDYKNPIKSGFIEELAYSYFKYEISYNYNISIKYNENLFNYFEDLYKSTFDEEVKKEYMGKSFKANASVNNYSEFSLNDDDYSKKIAAVKKECKKNNIFDKIKMSVRELY